MEGLNELAAQIHANNKKKGFFDEPKNIGEMLALVHSEVSEALECDRKDKFCSNEKVKWVNGIQNDEDFQKAFGIWVKDTFPAELVDILIRDLDLAAFKGVDIEEFVKAVMRNNSLRPFKHGKKY